MIGLIMNSSRTNWFGRMDHRILLTCSLLAVLAGLTAYKTRSKWWMNLLTNPCPNPKTCKTEEFHTHHLTPLGKWHFVYRFGLLDKIIPDTRPQPPAGEPWYGEYKKAWEAEFNMQCHSSWVRDANGYWVWVTDTPVWDRDWFDGQGWQFPGSWITVGSRDFYTVGSDELSTIVSLEPQGGASATEDRTS